MTTADPSRWAWADIDLGALDHNIRTIADAVDPAAVWAVVKANGYGHGAVDIAGQALASGAAGLCVALAAEGIELRRAGIDAPILVLSQQPDDVLTAMIDAALIATVYTDDHLDAIVATRPDRFEIHVKVDTGMHRVGADPSTAVALVRRATQLAPAIGLCGVYTHLACADEPHASANVEQLERFRAVLDVLAADGNTPPLVHAANSAGALGLPDARFDLVRAGIAIYGISPGPGVDELAEGLRPVLSLRGRVSHIQRVAAGEHVSYGWRHRLASATTIVTVPIGYADGVPRRLGTLPDRPGADVLIGGARCPIVGVVTMDQLMVDVGQLESPVAVGDEVVLIGRQGDDAITAEEWARRLGTIGYEIVCGVGARVPRKVHPA